MPKKLVIDVDPGIGDAIAIIAALLDPELDVLALTATSGCVSGAIATRNLQAIVEQLDIPKWPRIGAAATPPDPSTDSELTSRPAMRLLERLNGPGGLGEHVAEVAELLHHRESSKLLADLVKEEPNEITLLTLGPLQNVVAASERSQDFLNQLAGCVCLGGSLTVGGDVTAAAEANMLLAPEAARSVIRSAAPKLLIPLDVSNKVTLTLEQVQSLGSGKSRAGQFLHRLLQYALRAHHAHLGMESLLLREVVALAAIARPQLFRTEMVHLDVELRGELTRGMTIHDRRIDAASPNTAVAIDVDAAGVIDYLSDVILKYGRDSSD